ncbi:carbonyl reductase 1 [Usnea florida]
MSQPIVAVITGANRGIGEAIAQILAQNHQDPLALYATSRQGVNMAFKTASRTQVTYAKLDIADRSSVESLARTVKEKHGLVDVLINNAGVNLDNEYSAKNVKMTLDTNVRSTLQMCQIFKPLLRDSGRIVNISSTGSSLDQYSEEIQQRFRSPKITLQDLEDLIQEYQECANDGTELQHGWPQQAYSVSKACVNALTAVLARENPGLIINACCPGWVSTDMGKMVGSQPPKSPADGAKIPIRLGFGDIGDVTGRYWGNPSIADSGDGQVIEW